jgi:hypothetical protein
MHNAEYVLESGMLRTGIYQMRQAQLTAAMETFKGRRVQKPHLLRIKLNITMKVVPDDFHCH